MNDRDNANGTHDALVRSVQTRVGYLSHASLQLVDQAVSLAAVIDAAGAISPTALERAIESMRPIQEIVDARNARIAAIEADEMPPHEVG